MNMKSSSETTLFKIELIILLALVIPVYLASAVGGFNCSIMSSGSCGGGNTSVIYLENSTGGYFNAHAQNITGATYDYVICCNSSSSLTYGCNEGVFLKLQGAYQFDKCMNITVSNAGSSTLTNFPAYVNVTHDNDMLPDFKDIRFYDKPCNQGGTSLDYEIENYTASDRAHVWVRIPSLPAAGKNISIYYKNNTAVSSGENPSGVWDSNYVGVWHMDEVNANDSTSYQNNGTQFGGVIQTSGKIDGADEFDGSNDYIKVVDDESLNFGNFTNFTIELWVNVSSLQSTSYPVLLSKGGWGGTTQPGYNIYYNPNGNLVLRTKYNNTGMERSSVYNLTRYNLRDKLIHVAGRIHRGNQQELYINGTLRDQDSLAAYPNRNLTNDRNLTIGTLSTIYFNGTIDELRISDTVRSADWINQSYQMVENQGSFVSFDSEEEGPGIVGGSHVQRGDYSGPALVYGVNTCLTADPGHFNCTYVDDNCPANRECFASMASSNVSTNNNTDCHIGPCAEYTRKVCCRVITGPIVSYSNPTPANNSRQTTNSVVINVSVTTDSAVTADTCILEWRVDDGSPANETMEMWGSGSSVSCNITKATADGTNYTFRVYANDSVGTFGHEESRQFRENDEPDQVILTSPENQSHTTDRTPTFQWNVPNDVDGDSLTYTINITCFGGDCSDDNRYVTGIGTNSYTPPELQYFGDDNYYYNWSVHANDGYENGSWSDVWKLTIDTNVSIEMINNVVDFGAGRIPGYTNDTTDDSPNPFSLRNTGNCMIIVNISSSDLLWDVVTQPSDYFNYSVDWYTGEGGAFNWSGSQTSSVNIPQVDQNVTFIDYLNYTSGNSSAEIDIYIEVPSAEPPGSKSSTIVFTGEYDG